MDERIGVEWREEVRIVTLRRGRGNSLDPATLAALEEVFGVRPAPPTVLTGSGRSFCTGLDLDHALACDRDGMRALILGFHRAVTACFVFPAPVVAALGGHTLAGGALLAAACDTRVMAREAGRWGIHGAALGITYPTVAVEVLRAQFSRAQVEDILHTGRLVSPPQALAAGRVDLLVDAPELLTAAADLARSWAGGRAAAFAADKAARRRATADRLAAVEEEEAWLDRWFDPATQAAVRAARTPRPEGDAS